jgi:hypothetical protein
VAEPGLGVLADVLLHLAPEPLVVADLLAVRADGDDAAQRPDLVQHLLEPSAFLLERLLRMLVLDDFRRQPLVGLLQATVGLGELRRPLGDQLLEELMRSVSSFIG